MQGVTGACSERQIQGSCIGGGAGSTGGAGGHEGREGGVRGGVGEEAKGESLRPHLWIHADPGITLHPAVLGRLPTGQEEGCKRGIQGQGKRQVEFCR